MIHRSAINVQKIPFLLSFFIALSLHLNAQISTFPYVEDFESGWAGWSIVWNDATSWEYGTPSATIINSAASGTNAFATNLTGNYGPDEDGFLLSPIFDFSSVTFPIVEFNLWWNSEGDWDGAVLQWSTDQVSWQNVGNVGTGANWFNSTAINSNPGDQSVGWSGSETLDGEPSGGWVKVSHPINFLAGLPSVYFRLAFASDDIIHDEGVAFDDFSISDIGATVVAIPDPEFELALIDLGIDSDNSINQQVLLSDIYFVPELQISNYDVASFEGLQFFNSLSVFNNFTNNAPLINTIDFSGNLLLEEINIVNAPGLAEIDVSQNIDLNRLNIFSGGVLFDAVDVSSNVNLTFLGLTSNAITSLNIQNNNLIESLFVNNNPINALNVSNLSQLNTLVTNLTNIINLNLSNNPNLVTLLADNGALEEIDLRNGANGLITYLDVRDNPSLCAIYVEDVGIAEVQSDWFKDASANYIDGSTPIMNTIQPAEDLVLDFDMGYQAIVDNWLTNNGNAVVEAICGEVTWDYEIFDTELVDTDFNDTFDQLVISVDFFAYDDFGDGLSLPAQIIFNDFASAGESSGNGDTICENRYSVSDFDNALFTFPDEGAEYNESKYDASTFAIQQLSGKPGLALVDGTDVEFPDTGAGQFTYVFRFDVQTQVTIGSEEFMFETSTVYTANNVTVAFDPGPNITVTRCDFGSIDLSTLYDDLQIELDVDMTIYNEAEDFGNVFEPENFWYNETDNLEANPDIPPLTEITEPGTYQFNAKKFLQNCAGEPVFVTIEPVPLPNAGASDFFAEECLDDGFIDLSQFISDDADENGTWESLDGITILNVSEIDIPSSASGQTFGFIYKVTNDCGIEDEAQIDIELNFAPFVEAGESLFDISISPGIEDLNTFLSNDATFGGSWTGDLEVNDDGTVDFPDTGAGQFTYSFSYTVDNNCGTIDVATFDFVVDIPANAGIDGALEICAGDVITTTDLFNALNGTPQSGGTWSPEISGAGVYTYTITESQGDSANVTVTEQTPLMAGEDGALEINPGDTVTEALLFAALEGSPDPGGIWSPELAGIGVYTYVHPAGVCPESSATVTVTEDGLSVPESELENVSLFPNPASSTIYIKGNINDVLVVKIYAVTGQLVKELKADFKALDISRFDSGIYFIQITSNHQSKTLSFVKK